MSPDLPSLARALAGLLVLWSCAVGVAAAAAHAVTRSMHAVLAPPGQPVDQRVAAGLVLLAALVGAVTTAGTALRLTHTVASWLRGRAPAAPRSRLVATLLLATAGAGVAPPAAVGLEGSPGSHVLPHVLSGLPLPQLPEGRAARTPCNPREAAGRASVVIGPGDSLWSLAAARLSPPSTDARIERAWRALHLANQERLGPDPDLIHPGVRLTLPPLLRTGGPA